MSWSEENKEDFNKVKGQWYKVSNTTLEIDYPIFIKSYNEEILKLIIKKLSIEVEWNSKKPYSTNSYKTIYIKNISWSNSKIFKEITSKIYFKEYNLSFSKYNDEYYTFFKWVNYWDKIHDFTIHFNWKLEWKNTLEKTLNILSSESRSYNYLSISTDKDFKESYKVSKSDLDIFHKINSYWLHADFNLSEEITDNYLIKSFKSTKIWEYSLWKFWKWEWLNDKLGVKDEVTGRIIEIE